MTDLDFSVYSATVERGTTRPGGLPHMIDFSRRYVLGERMRSLCGRAIDPIAEPVDINQRPPGCRSCHRIDPKRGRGE